MAMQLELFQSARAVRVRVWAQAVWKNYWFGWVMIGFFSLWYAWWCYHVPSPAKAATVLGVIASIMAYRGEPEGFEKMFWTIILFAFLFLEINAIDNKERLDKLAHEADVQKEEQNFTGIGTGITKGVDAITKQSDAHFDKTVSQQNEQFEATMKKSQINLDEITGGDSYALVVPNLTPNPKNIFPLQVGVCPKCPHRYPLWDTHVFLQTNPQSKENGDKIYGGMINPTSFENSEGSITPSPSGETVYKISVFARNKPTIEVLTLRLDPSLGWQFKVNIERYEKMPHLNPKTGMAEGMVIKELFDLPWGTFADTPVNNKTTTTIKQH